MKTSIKIAVAVAATALTLGANAMAQITVYEHDGWRGRAITMSHATPDFYTIGFDNRASSVVVSGGRWEVCDGAQFSGTCMVLREGSYESLRGMGLNDRISSVRPLRRQDHYRNEAPEPLPAATYDYRRRPNEAVYMARVTSAHAVVGEGEQHCWVEREQVSEAHRNNIGGAIAGALIGGVLGHQVGGGTGRDVATAGGAVAGAAIGANAGNGSGSTSRDVRRCETTPSSAPKYWDVTYNYAGQEHRIQMASAPGSSIAVNRNGEPRQ
ncbi:MAG: beta/gamma crystallin-related protein [Pseudomonadota bacterium]